MPTSSKITEAQKSSLREVIRQLKHEVDWIDCVLNYKRIDGKTKQIAGPRREKVLIEIDNLENILKVIESL